MPLKLKLTVSIISISVILIVSGVISLYEYSCIGASASAFAIKTDQAAEESGLLKDLVNSYRETLPYSDTLGVESADSSSFASMMPVLDQLSGELDILSDEMSHAADDYSTLLKTIFYRSIIPGVVAVGVGLIMILMLLFFMLIYYINPLYKMLDGLKNYRSFNKKYTCPFDGDDQLSELNTNISELVAENQQLRKRLADLRSKLENGN